jgi:hypothetical protein
LTGTDFYLWGSWIPNPVLAQSSTRGFSFVAQIVHMITPYFRGYTTAYNALGDTEPNMVRCKEGMACYDPDEDATYGSNEYSLLIHSNKAGFRIWRDPGSMSIRGDWNIRSYPLMIHDRKEDDFDYVTFDENQYLHQETILNVPYATNQDFRLGILQL